jgi:hypothetical protein
MTGGSHKSVTAGEGGAERRVVGRLGRNAKLDWAAARKKKKNAPKGRWAATELSELLGQIGVEQGLVRKKDLNILKRLKQIEFKLEFEFQ